MMPLGFSPILFNPETIVCRLVPCSGAMFPPASLTDTDVFGVVTVCPFDSGAGCDTSDRSVTLTVMPPCEIATGAMRTSLPITIVPVRSSTTTRAGASRWRRTGALMAPSSRVCIQPEFIAVPPARRARPGGKMLRSHWQHSAPMLHRFFCTPMILK